MASGMIHLTFSKLLEADIVLRDRSRFRLGHILPDMTEGKTARDKSHYMEKADGGASVVIRFDRFQNDYLNETCIDDLYLGYYLHLIQDAMFRRYIYQDKKIHREKEPNFVERLYNDYSLLNSYCKQKFHVDCDIEFPTNFRQEKINDISSFCVAKMTSKEDIDITHKGPATIFGETMLDEFLNRYLPVCAKEAEEVRKQSTALSPMDFKWDA